MSTWQAGELLINGVHIYYERSGSGQPALLFVHGLTDSGHYWRPILGQLPPGYELVLYDARGHGRSEQPPGGYTYDQLAEDLAGVITALNLAQPIVIGHSMGAATAALMAARHPGLARALILEDPPAGRGITTEQLQAVFDDWRTDLLATKALGPAEKLAKARATRPDWAEADYAEMIQKGWAVLYVGTATFKGVECHSSDAASPESERYDFTKLPKTVKFRFGFHTPTQYVNCQNSDLKGRAFAGEESQRGVQVREHGDTVAQITLHVDHPFWSTVDHDAAELYFDQIAAAATADGTVTLEDLGAVDFTSFKDRSGKSLPWRSCVAEKTPKEGMRKFDSGSVPVDPQASPDAALRNYSDYIHYQQSTEGHLNADGLCAVKRLFPSPR